MASGSANRNPSPRRPWLVPDDRSGQPGVTGRSPGAAGETAVDLAVPVRADRRAEDDETFGLTAFVSGGEVRVANPVATVTIVDDD